MTVVYQSRELCVRRVNNLCFTDIIRRIPRLFSPITTVIQTNFFFLPYNINNENKNKSYIVFTCHKKIMYNEHGRQIINSICTCLLQILKI